MPKALETLKTELRALKWDGRTNEQGSPVVSVELFAPVAIDALKAIEALEEKASPTDPEAAFAAGERVGQLICDRLLRNRAQCESPEPKDAPVEIKPGPELDWAVAEAVGVGVHRVKESTRWQRDDNLYPFIPSIDLNEAFAAAEKVELFVGGACTTRTPGDLRKDSHGQWAVLLRTGCYSEDTVRADTPALAICAAILKLGEEER